MCQQSPLVIVVKSLVAVTLWFNKKESEYGTITAFFPCCMQNWKWKNMLCHCAIRYTRSDFKKLHTASHGFAFYVSLLKHKIWKWTPHPQSPLLFYRSNLLYDIQLCLKFKLFCLATMDHIKTQSIITIIKHMGEWWLFHITDLQNIIHSKNIFQLDHTFPL